MEIDAPLPRWVAWPLRAVFWLVALPLIALAAWLSAHVSLASHVDLCLGRFNTAGTYQALHRTRNFMACLDHESGSLDGLLLHREQRLLARMPSTPVRFVGDWIATRPGARYRIALRADGSFDAVPLPGTPSGGEQMSGNWSAVDGRLIWLYDAGRAWPPDINPVVETVDRPAADAPFDLVEADGSRTHYQRERSAASTLP